MACEEVFVQRLRAHGYRLTAQRRLVLEALHAMPGLCSAEALHQQLADRNPAVDLSTVYRTLDLLRHLGLVGAVEAAEGGERLYALNGAHGPHVHLVCRRCGRVLGVAPEAFDAAAEAIAREHGFCLDLTDLSLSGLCADCAGPPVREKHVKERLDVLKPSPS